MLRKRSSLGGPTQKRRRSGEEPEERAACSINPCSTGVILSLSRYANSYRGYQLMPVTLANIPITAVVLIRPVAIIRADRSSWGRWRRFGQAFKFWEIEVSGKEVIVRFGRNGTSGQSSTKTFDNEVAAAKHADKLVGEKVGKGYVEVG